ncbi:MAG: hypothetical protein IPK44_00545 [Candidatus Accumulibacter sp.]|jgi:hypothetical protein|uniref:hypothetical protein n=1 Tax=Accumulibacter sp. TaxID=2053492 RepID=UPI002589FA4A|nr:hypothetical protein [Accumulibacter sp.]MBK8113096.1 hypothetical protein [Accumulibacter sp.]
MFQSFRRKTALTVAVSMIVGSNGAAAQTPGDLSDLVDMRGRDAESQMEERGYVSHHTSKGDDAAYTYWWNNRDKRCVRVRTRDGRYEQIKAVGNSDCDQRDHSGSKVAAVAIGAAALLGLAALASKSHHREDRDLDERQTAQFERGYRDGLHNQPFHNYEDSKEYSDGYTKGVDQRRQETSYRSDYGSRGGNRAYVNVSDLSNHETTYTWGQLERRGFSLANERKLNNGDNQWLYWNDSTRQCVEVVSRDTWVSYVGEASATACRK